MVMVRTRSETCFLGIAGETDLMVYKPLPMYQFFALKYRGGMNFSLQM